MGAPIISKIEIRKQASRYSSYIVRRNYKCTTCVKKFMLVLWGLRLASTMATIRRRSKLWNFVVKSWREQSGADSLFSGTSGMTSEGNLLIYLALASRHSLCSHLCNVENCTLSCDVDKRFETLWRMGSFKLVRHFTGTWSSSRGLHFIERRRRLAYGSQLVGQTAHDCSRFRKASRNSWLVSAAALESS